jgi:hypothetical protein
MPSTYTVKFSTADDKERYHRTFKNIGSVFVEKEGHLRLDDSGSGEIAAYFASGEWRHCIKDDTDR